MQWSHDHEYRCLTLSTFFLTVFHIQISETDHGWWTWSFWGSDMLILSMDEGKYLSLLEFPLLFSAELSKSAGAEPTESCATVPRGGSMPSANSGSWYLLIWHPFNDTQWYLHNITVKTVHSGLLLCELLMQHTRSPACRPFYGTTAMIY